jgi:hypothetical protein
MPDVQHPLTGLAPEAVLGALNEGTLDNLPIAVAVYDLDARLQGCNARWLEYAAHYSGRPASTFTLGTRVPDLLPEAGPWGEALRACLESGHAESRTASPLLTAEGETVYYDFFFAPIVRDGRSAGVVHVLADITERVLSYQLLEERVTERTQELDRRREVADGLHDVLSILNSCCPAEEVMDYILGQAKRLLGGEAAAVYRLADGDPGISSVGGLRASLYNALPVESAKALADFMVEFQRKNG